MKTHSLRLSFVTTVAAIALFSPSLPAQTAEAVAAPVFGKAADNKNYAQQLVNQLMKENPDLYSAGIHAVPPGKKDMVIIAQTKDLIGKKSSASDLKILNEDQVQFQPEDKGGGNKFIAVVAPLRSSSGEILGLAVISYKEVAGITNLTLHVRNNVLLDELARSLPDHAALFGPMR
jgi:hypothetical protein